MKNLIRLRFFFVFPLKYTIMLEWEGYQVLIFLSFRVYSS